MYISKYPASCETLRRDFEASRFTEILRELDFGKRAASHFTYRQQDQIGLLEERKRALEDLSSKVDGIVAQIELLSTPLNICLCKRDPQISLKALFAKKRRLMLLRKQAPPYLNRKLSLAEQDACRKALASRAIKKRRGRPRKEHRARMNGKQVSTK